MTQCRRWEEASLVPDELFILLPVDTATAADLVDQELRFAYAPTTTQDIMLWSNFWDARAGRAPPVRHLGASRWPGQASALWFTGPADR